MNYIIIEKHHLVQAEDKVEIIKYFINIHQIFHKNSDISKKQQEEEVAHMSIIVLLWIHYMLKWKMIIMSEIVKMELIYMDIIPLIKIVKIINIIME